jgi:hypothetical protein
MKPSVHSPVYSPGEDDAMDETGEQWEPIPGFEGYEASTGGRIRNRRGRVLAGTVTKKGYKQVNLRRGHKRVAMAVHRLVALAFLGPISSDFLVVHLNGNRLDCRPSNLELTTPAGVVQHATDLGLSWPAHARGESNPSAKLTEDEVRQMRALRQQGVSAAELGRRFGVTERSAHRVVTRRDWGHVA